MKEYQLVVLIVVIMVALYFPIEFFLNWRRKHNEQRSKEF